MSTTNTPGTDDVAGSARLGVGPVVVGVDGSAESQRGLVFAANLARAIGVDLVVVHALGLLAHVGEAGAPSHGHESEIEAELRSRWCSPLAAFDDVVWRAEIVQGDAVDGMLREADAVEAGLIVVGSHGAGNSEAPLLGSTSHALVRNSHLPVIVVPPEDNHPSRVVRPAPTT